MTRTEFDRLRPDSHIFFLPSPLIPPLFSLRQTDIKNMMEPYFIWSFGKEREKRRGEEVCFYENYIRKEPKWSPGNFSKKVSVKKRAAKMLAFRWKTHFVLRHFVSVLLATIRPWEKRRETTFPFLPFSSFLFSLSCISWDGTPLFHRNILIIERSTFQANRLLRSPFFFSFIARNKPLFIFFSSIHSYFCLRTEIRNH